MKPLQGLVSNIERFAIHDGPGIRSLVFMKGCPLKCLWCSSPQTQKPAPEILYDVDHCQSCGTCAEVCPERAVVLSKEGGVKIDLELCTCCGECANACPYQALELVGRYMTAKELFKEVEKDSPFYRRSRGGVTVGGGEPAMQHEFVAEFLKDCKQRYLHTAMETCGYVKWDDLKKLLKYLDLVYIDIKSMDNSAHKEFTGVSNKLILENAARISAVKPMVVRLPIVPGYNDSEDNVLTAVRFAAGLGENLHRIELLPFHKLGEQTYSRLGRKYTLHETEPPGASRMERLKEIVESCDLNVQIGG